MTTLRRVTLAALAALLVLPAGASAAENRHSDSMSFVKNLPYDVREDLGQSISYGTDLQFGVIRGNRYAFAGSELNGLQIVDITRPRRANIVSAYDCAVSQGDVQVFKRGSRTFVTYTNDYEDTVAAAESRCYQEALRRGFDAVDEDGAAKLGTLILDVSNPSRPRTVSFVEIPTGSHNMTVHPSGDYLYNSNSDLITSVAARPPAIEVFDISDFSEPKAVAEVPLSPLPGLGTESHDITFNEEGTRAYSAALSHGVIINTEDPANPVVISEYDDEAINVWHQSNPVTIAGRDFLIVEDELAGAAAPGVCPTGGVHVFDVSDETMPVKVGYWNIDDPALRNPDDTCTAHVFDIHEDEQIMTIAYYMGGVRVVDLSGLADAPIGVGQGDQAIGGAMREIGHYVMSNANAWSAKTPFIESDGDFYLYADDINRGFDVFHYDAQAAPSENAGTFQAAAATTRSAGLALPNLSRATAKRKSGGFLCLLKRRASQR
ncbi:MAG TPA: hypothetical protein VF587_05560 [Solirubrobacteraceae bacterium]|jgi:hypothetical protein